MKRNSVVEVSALASTPKPHSPVMPGWEAANAWLAEYFLNDPPWTIGDNLGTCYSSFAAVMLCAIVLGTESPMIIAGVTSYPAPYVAAVMLTMQRSELWALPSVCYLRSLAETMPFDCHQLPGALNDAMERVWWVAETIPWRTAIEALRQGALFGGNFQRWADEESLEYFELI